MKKTTQILGILLLLLTNIILFAQDKPVSYYDFIGKDHNKALDMFFSDYSSARVKSEKLNISGLNSYVSQLPLFSNPALILNVLNSRVYVENRKTALEELPSSLTKQGAISELCASYISDINSLIDKDFGGNSLSANIIALEDQIFKDNKLSETEKSILLSSTSTAKSSSAFWLEKTATLSTQWAEGNKTAFIYDKYEEETSKSELTESNFLVDEIRINNVGNSNNDITANKKGNTDDNDRVMKTFLYNCGKRLVKGDIAGAVSGAVGGALVGGVGALPGALAGAVVGSVYEAVSCFLDWLF